LIIISPIVNQLKDESGNPYHLKFSDMAKLDYDDPKWDDFIKQMTLDSASSALVYFLISKASFILSLIFKPVNFLGNVACQSFQSLSS